MATLAETAAIVTDIVFAFEGLVLVAAGGYFLTRRRRAGAGTDLDLNVRPSFVGRQDDEALYEILNSASKWWPSRAGCLYVHDSDTGMLTLIAADLTASGTIYDGTALDAPPMPSPPLTLPPWQGTVEARVLRGPELRHSPDAWLALPFADGRAVVRLLENRGKLPNRPILAKMTEACRRNDALVATCLNWRNAQMLRREAVDLLGTAVTQDAGTVNESVAAMLALGRGLTGARDACFVVQDADSVRAVALGGTASAYAQSLVSDGVADLPSSRLEVAVASSTGSSRLVFFDTDSLDQTGPRLQWVRNLGGFAAELLTGESVSRANGDAYLQTVRSLVRADEDRNPHMAGHDDRVARYARWIAEGIGLPSADVSAIAQAAYLHDVGMPFTAPEVASHAGRLEAEAFDRMTQHVEVSALLVERVEASLPLAPMVLGHHERWDGTGYPLGLRGTEIPLGARIIAVADRFDALSTARVYRDPLSFDEASERLAGLAGTALDPDLVDAMLSAWSRRQDNSVQGLPILRCWELKQLDAHVCGACPNRLSQVVRCWDNPKNLCTRHGDRCETCIVFSHAVRTGLAQPRQPQEGSVMHNA